MFQSENLKKSKENYEKQMSQEMYNLEQEISQQRVNTIQRMVKISLINTIYYISM